MPFFIPPSTRRRNSTTKIFHCLPIYSHLRSIYWSSLCTGGGGRGGVTQQSLVRGTPARGSLVKFQEGGIVVKTMLCASGFAEFLYQRYPCLSKHNVSLKLRGGVSDWVPCCCTDTGLLSGMHLG